jgi:hypothetical protein
MNDSSELTPWEDINPPMASAQRHGQLSKSSDDEARTVFRNELTACLTLVAPVGMDEETRRDWFAVAWQTLKDIPPDLLVVGAKAARLKCDHPSKIVPTIMAEIEDSLKFRRTISRNEEPLQIAGPKPQYCTAEEAAEILAQYGLKRTNTVS